MGIKGLLKFLKPATQSCHLSSLRGNIVGVDAMGWMHRGAMSCAADIVLGRDTDGFLQFFVKMIVLLDYYDITPLIVFDGPSVASKSTENEARRQKRELAAAEAKRMDPNTPEFHSKAMQAVSVSSDMIDKVMITLRRLKVPFIVAPGEADAQLAFFARIGLCSCVISEDSDLLVFGCPKVLYKLDKYGVGELIDFGYLHACEFQRIKNENDKLISFKTKEETRNTVSSPNSSIATKTSSNRFQGGIILGKSSAERKQMMEIESSGDASNNGGGSSSRASEKVTFCPTGFVEYGGEARLGSVFDFILESGLEPNVDDNRNLIWLSSESILADAVNAKELLWFVKRTGWISFVEACVMIGCDYISEERHIKGLGFQTVIKHLKRYGSMQSIIKAVGRCDSNVRALKLPPPLPDEETGIIPDANSKEHVNQVLAEYNKAVASFFYHPVFDVSNHNERLTRYASKNSHDDSITNSDLSILLFHPSSKSEYSEYCNKRQNLLLRQISQTFPLVMEIPADWSLVGDLLAALVKAQQPFTFQSSDGSFSHEELAIWAHDRLLDIATGILDSRRGFKFRDLGSLSALRDSEAVLIDKILMERRRRLRIDEHSGAVNDAIRERGADLTIKGGQVNANGNNSVSSTLDKGDKTPTSVTKNPFLAPVAGSQTSSQNTQTPNVFTSKSTPSSVLHNSNKGIPILRESTLPKLRYEKENLSDYMNSLFEKDTGYNEDEEERERQAQFLMEGENDDNEVEKEETIHLLAKTKIQNRKMNNNNNSIFNYSSNSVINLEEEPSDIAITSSTNENESNPANSLSQQQNSDDKHLDIFAFMKKKTPTRTSSSGLRPATIVRHSNHAAVKPAPCLPGESPSSASNSQTPYSTTTGSASANSAASPVQSAIPINALSFTNEMMAMAQPRRVSVIDYSGQTCRTSSKSGLSNTLKAVSGVSAASTAGMRDQKARGDRLKEVISAAVKAVDGCERGGGEKGSVLASGFATAAASRKSGLRVLTGADAANRMINPQEYEDKSVRTAYFDDSLVRDLNDDDALANLSDEDEDNDGRTKVLKFKCISNEGSASTVDRTSLKRKNSHITEDTKRPRIATTSSNGSNLFDDDEEMENEYQNDQNNEDDISCVDQKNGGGIVLSSAPSKLIKDLTARKTVSLQKSIGNRPSGESTFSRKTNFASGFLAAAAVSTSKGITVAQGHRLTKQRITAGMQLNWSKKK